MSKFIDKVKYMTETYLMLNMLRLLGSTRNWRSNKLDERLYALLKVSWLYLVILICNVTLRIQIPEKKKNEGAFFLDKNTI